MPPFGGRGISGELNKILNELNQRNPEIRGSILIRRDGLILTHALPRGTDKDVTAGMGASIINIVKRTLDELKGGKIGHISVSAGDMTLVIHDVVPDVFLVAIAEKDANLGLLLMEIKRAANKIKEILSK